MNTIKTLKTNIYNIPTIIQLTKNNKSIILNKINSVKYYNKIYKQYLHLPTVYTIKNNNYA